MFISRCSSTVQCLRLSHYHNVCSVFFQLLEFWGTFMDGCYCDWEWNLWLLSVDSLLLSVCKLRFVHDETRWWWIMALLVDDITCIWLLCGGWVYYIKLVVYLSAMMKISYKGILQLEESYFMYTWDSRIKWLVCFSEVRDHLMIPSYGSQTLPLYCTTCV